MKPRRSIYLLVVVLGLIVTLGAAETRAIRYQPRPAWMAGVGLGVGRGQFTNVPGSFFYLEDGERSEYTAGVNPEIRFGRMLGTHFQVGLSYSGWLTEFGNIAPVGPDKWRRTMQTSAAAIPNSNFISRG